MSLSVVSCRKIKELPKGHDTPMQTYSRRISTKSLSSVACNINEPRLISHFVRVREMCVQISVFVQSVRWMCQCWSAYVVAAFMGLK